MGQLVSWVAVAVIVALLLQWLLHHQGHGGTRLTGKEPAADLDRLNESSQDGSDLAEQSNRHNFAIPHDVQESKVDYEIFLNPDCSPVSDFSLYISQAPLHGTARIAADTNYSSYDKDSQRYRCNLLPIKTPSIFYRRNAGFVGRDRFAVEVFEPGGFVRLTNYFIDAR